MAYPFYIVNFMGIDGLAMQNPAISLNDIDLVKPW